MSKSSNNKTSDFQIRSVAAESLRRRVDPKVLKFKTTAELDPVTGLVGQERALAAIEFGAGIAQPAFNLFVMGPPGAGKTTAVRSFLNEKAALEKAPDDWVYVNNFDAPHKPRAIALPKGRAVQLSQCMIDVVDELRSALPAQFESEEYQGRRQAIDEETHGSQEEAFTALNKQAEAANIAILRTPLGFAMAPVKDGKVIKPDAFNELPEAERLAIQKKIEGLQEQLGVILKQVPRLEKDRRKRIRELNNELAEVAVQSALGEVEGQFGDLPDVADYLKKLKADLITNATLFLSETGDDGEPVAHPVESARDARFRRYMVNVVIGDGSLDGAPILEEDNPTLGNLVGRVEHLSQMGTLVTDFLLIKPGALHRANSGYLLLDARKVLLQPFAWEGLKRALKAQEITIESPAEQLSMVSTVSLEPDRIPLRLKAVLFGDRMLYYLLSALDPDFPGLFKVVADFDDTMDHTGENADIYARLVASIVARHELRPVDSGGVARIIDEGARLAADAEKLTLRIESIVDILCEADYWASQAGRKTIKADDVARAVKENIFRQDRLRQKAQESITRDIMLVDTHGFHVGQINGLSVLSLGGFSFGRPSRITARVRMGTGRLIDIEREVELGGPLHSKGVMILRGFIDGRYAHGVPLSLSASLVFEQSYGGIDGDSASSAELYTLLSALAEVPLKQSIAVTGSVNQHGQVQAIGGVNEKIEGFYDICNERGLTGDQGVIIPKSNLVHLMLRDDVVEAAKRNRFRVWAVEAIDEGMEILTGITAGTRGKDGLFPEATLNRRVEDRLVAFAEARRKFGARADAKSGDREE
ncbi:MAG: AAA family ATPase [Hyphomicrobiales bacterium]|nr:AAA family ATPase [Hyphomicrobiales bacterium]